MRRVADREHWLQARKDLGGKLVVGHGLCNPEDVGQDVCNQLVVLELIQENWEHLSDDHPLGELAQHVNQTLEELRLVGLGLLGN